MTEKGYSWPEAMLTLTISMLIFGTLLPFASMMTDKLERKKMEMVASETALQGIIIYRAHGLREGIREVNHTFYEWNYDGHSICVTYVDFNEILEKCITL